MHFKHKYLNLVIQFPPKQGGGAVYRETTQWTRKTR